MLKQRVIPALLLHHGGLVKTCKFKKPKYVGDPINAIRIFNEKEVDELIVLDISASKEAAEPNFSLIEEFASECFMPLCYGGGISKISHARRLFKNGVEKVCLQSAILKDNQLLKDIVGEYGSKSVVVSIELKINIYGKIKLYDSSKGKVLKKDWLKHLKDLELAGAGEVFLNFVNNDGVMSGLNLNIIEEATNNLSIPLIACGGVGSLEHIKEGVKAGASAIAAGAFFVFQGTHKAVLITYPKYAELESLLMDDK